MAPGLQDALEEVLLEEQRDRTVLIDASRIGSAEKDRSTAKTSPTAAAAAAAGKPTSRSADNLLCRLNVRKQTSIIEQIDSFLKRKG